MNPLSDKFFLKDFFEFIGGALSYINPFSENFIFKDFFTNFLDWFNPFSENFILKRLWEFLNNIISYINPLDENFLGKKIIELLSDLFETLFVPSEDSINNLVNSVKSKFEFVDTINTTIKTIEEMFSGTTALPKITLNLTNNKYYTGEITVMDLSWYAPYKQYGDLIISAFIYVFFLWRIFIKLPSIISGTGGGISDLDTTITKINERSIK